MGRRIYLYTDKALNEEILKKAYELRFTIHLESIKTYKYLKEFYQWPTQKKKITEFIAKN